MISYQLHAVIDGATAPVHAEDLMRVNDGKVYTDWHEAIAVWYRHDDARRDGKRPHVRYYAVRDSDDSLWTDSKPSPAHFEDARIADGILTDSEYAVIIDSLAAMRDRCLVGGIDPANVKSALAKITRGCTPSTYGMAFTLIEAPSSGHSD